MIAIAAFIVSLSRESWNYAYETVNKAHRVYIGEHFYRTLVSEHWCVKVYTAKGVHVCVI